MQLRQGYFLSQLLFMLFYKSSITDIFIKPVSLEITGVLVKLI